MKNPDFEIEVVRRVFVNEGQLAEDLARALDDLARSVVATRTRDAIVARDLEEAWRVLAAYRGTK